MRIVTRQPLLIALVLAAGVGACGSTAARRARTPTPAVIATNTTTASSVLPFTQFSRADLAFAKRSDKRCRASLAAFRRLAQPTTLLDQATYSRREVGLLSGLLSQFAPLTPPADQAKTMSSYRRAVRSVARADGFVIDAADAQNGEGVAYWLSRRAGARSALTGWADALDAPDCEP